jgi:lipopolysaccharide export system permease protein
MRLPVTLSLYVGRHFLMAIFTTILVLLLIVGLLELLELIRRTSDNARGVSFWILLQMVLLKLPVTAEKIYPFAVMIGGMIALSRLTRSSELVVARAAGVSVWQFLLPGVLMVALLGVFFVGLLNPIGALTIGQFERMESRYVSNKPSQLSVLPSGLWLRQESERAIMVRNTLAHETIMHAARMNQSNYVLEQVMVQFFDTTRKFIGRVDAPQARLAEGEWVISDATLSTPEGLPATIAELRIPTTLTIAQIQDSFSAPETFSFWQLPGFIAVLEQAGFSALQHRLHFHSLMAMPLLLAGMLLLAAVFSMRPPRRGRTGILIVIGLAIGFLVYFLTNIIYALGASGDLPIVLAGWAPSLMIVMLASAVLLHLEDG